MKRIFAILIVALFLIAVMALTTSVSFAAQCDRDSNNKHCLNPGGQPKGENREFVNPGQG